DPFKAGIEIFEFAKNKEFRRQLLAGLPSVPDGYTQNRLDKIRGTHIEDLMINEEVKMGLTGGGLLPGQELSADLKQALSPVSWASAAAQLQQRDYNRKLLQRGHCSYDREFVDDNIYGLAKEFYCTEEEWTQFDTNPDSLGGKKCLKGDDLRWELTGRIFGGVMEHEVGHTVGLRHNFGGSVDVLNFNDNYYDVREKQSVYCQKSEWCDDENGETCDHDSKCSANTDCAAGLTCGDTGYCEDASGNATGVCIRDGAPVQKFVPRPFMTHSERQNKMSEYQYSTVMDYGGRVNSDIHGLGKYDKAALRFGYGNLVDTYAETTQLRDRVEALSKYYGRDPSYFAYLLNTEYWRYAGSMTHPFAYLENYIGVDANKQRYAASYEKVKLEHAMQDNYDDGEFNWTYIEVPYRFCSDEYRGNLNCEVWDTGVDIGEIVHNALNQIDEYYVMDAFKRDRMYLGSDRFIQYYFSRVLSRFLAPMGTAGRYFAIYNHIYSQFPFWEDFVENPFGPRALRDAAKTSFNNLARILAAPAPGSYKKGDDNVLRNITYDLDVEGSELSVPVGVGKFPYSQWMAPDEYGYFNHVVWVGSFWLKLAAMLTLTDSTFYSSSDWVGEQLEIGRSSAVGFSTLYQRELTNLLGGIVAESLENYSGVVSTDNAGKPVFKPRDLFDLDADKDKDVVEPGLNNLTLKLYSSVLGLANIPSGFDPSFIDSMAVFLKGSGKEYQLVGAGGGVKTQEFHDPFGGKTYIAYTPNYDTGRLPAAYKVVKDAQLIREQWEEASGGEKIELAVRLKEKIQILDILRELHSIYGNLTY
ncbi:MAG TPA: hypothetical protein EYN66_24450, partial [Myxococcales bacterium]|nr:hypothetical protein [Myxococcales bacterium]